MNVSDIEAEIGKRGLRDRYAQALAEWADEHANVMGSCIELEGPGTGYDFVVKLTHISEGGLKAIGQRILREGA